MDSETFKHMTLQRATFDAFEVILPYNVHLGNNSVIKAIGIISIIVEAILKEKIARICIEKMFKLSKLHANFLSVSKFVSHGLKVKFNLIKCIVKFYNCEAITKAICMKLIF